MTKPPLKTTILTAEGLHKTYRMGAENLHVLRGVDLAVQRGEWLAVLGASGSGKSTLLHLMGALDRPRKGNVFFEGTDIFALRGSRLDRYRNTHVGFVFQFYHLLPELNAVDNVLIAAMVGTSIPRWLSARAELRRRATDLLEELGLGHRLRHRPPKLSGGERQRVAIGRALINRPDILLADEPTGNLDTRTGGQILDLLGRIHAQGQTIVMVTHDSRVAERADRRVQLESGRVCG
jgi:lipoprotein-releasing system ATP-binding protein